MISDETWVFAKGNVIKSCQDGGTMSVRRRHGRYAKRYVILHAGRNSGFVENVGLLCGSKSNVMDHHGEMNAEMFTKWYDEKLIPNLEAPSLIIIDNASYHRAVAEKQPCTSW